MTRWEEFGPASLGRGSYVDWWELHEGRSRLNRDAFQFAAERNVALGPYEFADSTFEGLSALAREARAQEAQPFYGIDDQVPIPKVSANDAWDPGDDWLEPAMDVDLIPKLDADSVILGIIDTGIPIGHDRFRMQNGRTRLLAAWQQTASFEGQAFLPFGRELHANGIDALLQAHTHDGHLDEEALNLAAGLVEPHVLTGQRDLDRRASHGAHVLDLAAGIDAREGGAPADLARRLRIIAVNLPPQFLHGPAGDFLQFFASFGLRRIVGLADALWQRDHAGHPQGAFPIALNMSYGMQAGPKDGSGWLDRLMRALVAQREPGGGQPESSRKPPLRIQMPAGNANLDRCAARLILDPGSDAALGWRIQPGDQTSNHVEIWSPPYDAAAPLDPADFALAFALPNRPPAWAPEPIAGHCASFGTFARLCCHEHWVEPGGQLRRLVFLLSVARTFRVEQEFGDIAPAGRWTILLRGPQGLEVDAFVQSDQSFVLKSPIGRRSYFDDPGYQTHWENGRSADSFCYRDGQPALGGGPVSRHGTHNALGSAAATIAGYRMTDGKPAIYSSTGWSAAEITASYPSEDGAAHPGLRASGSRNGSAMRFVGTSMATALATRDIAMGMLAHTGVWFPSGLFGQASIMVAAAADEAARPAVFEDIYVAKGGAGRIKGEPLLRTRRVSRI